LGSHALDAAFRFTQKRIDHAFFKYRGVAAVQDLLGYLLQSPSMYFKPFSFFLGDAGNNTTMAQTRYQAISGDVLATKLGLPGSPFRFVALNGSRSQRRFPRAGNQRPAITR